ncbi:MAG: hypothetical protein HRU34_10140 [Richelia sp.]|nr:hypothetical protein [Richelia sp.]
MGIRCKKGDGLGLFNIAVYCEQKYRNNRSKKPWYILTHLPTFKQTLEVYPCCWGIEQFFKDCKTGGYNLEEAKVNETRFLALVLLIIITYSLGTMHCQQMQRLSLEHQSKCIKKHKSERPPQSHLSFALYGQRWIYAMELWADLALGLGVAESGDDFTTCSTISQWFQTLIHPYIMGVA